MINRKLIISLALLVQYWCTIPASAVGALVPYSGTVDNPNLALHDIDNRRHNLLDYRGKVILVNFWASWCTPCVKEMPSLDRVADTLRDHPFGILAINVSEPNHRIKRFLEHIDVDITILLDQDAAIFKAWQLKVLPTSFLLDAEGQVRYEAVGAIEWDTEEVVTIIEGLISERH